MCLSQTSPCYPNLGLTRNYVQKQSFEYMNCRPPRKVWWGCFWCLRQDSSQPTEISQRYHGYYWLIPQLIGWFMGWLTACQVGSEPPYENHYEPLGSKIEANCRLEIYSTYQLWVPTCTHHPSASQILAEKRLAWLRMMKILSPVSC